MSNKWAKNPTLTIKVKMTWVKMTTLPKTGAKLTWVKLILAKNYVPQYFHVWILVMQIKEIK